MARLVSRSRPSEAPADKAPQDPQSPSVRAASKLTSRRATAVADSDENADYSVADLSNFDKMQPLVASTPLKNNAQPPFQVEVAHLEPIPDDSKENNTTLDTTTLSKRQTTRLNQIGNRSPEHILAEKDVNVNVVEEGNNTIDSAVEAIRKVTLNSPAKSFAHIEIPQPTEIKPRLVIHKLVLINFKSYAGVQEIGPFHSVSSFSF
jgi:hypothetical protein